MKFSMEWYQITMMEAGSSLSRNNKPECSKHTNISRLINEYIQYAIYIPYHTLVYIDSMYIVLETRDPNSKSYPHYCNRRLFESCSMRTIVYVTSVQPELAKAMSSDIIVGYHYKLN